VSSQIRNSVFTKILWGLLALHLLNISVDTADPNPENIPEDLTINDQESVIEIILEKVLDYENAIKEYDDHDTEDYNKKTVAKFDLTTHPIVDNTLYQPFFTSKRHEFPDYNPYLTNGFQKLDIPPPKI
jgi:hypothetical protein